MLPAMFWGMTAPWTLVASGAMCLWLMFSPAVLGSSGWAADVDHVAGALILTFAVISMAGVVRSARFFNAPLGLWVLLAPWLVDGHGAIAQWLDPIVGAIAVVLVLPRGRIVEKYGPWTRKIR